MQIINDIWLGWTVYESGSAGFRQVGGDSGHAYGKYQFDYRYGLVPLMESCVNYNSSRYTGFDPYITLGAGNNDLINNKGLIALWLNYCDNYPEEFEKLQDDVAKKNYYDPINLYLKEIGIRLDNHSAALKGSAFSMSIRSGAQTAASKFDQSKDTDPDMTILQRAYATYGTTDDGRWPRQLADALKVLESTTAATLYRVGTAWISGKCKHQHGAFTSFINAKSDADAVSKANKKTYYVFNNSGKITYTAKYTPSPTTIVFSPYNVRVTTKTLNIRTDAGTNHPTNGVCPVGVYAIVKEKSVNGYTWGKLKSGIGWISLKYTEKI